jgi:tRNA dimethylallyltransferase
MPKLTVILGPTGVGKTDLSLQLAEQWGCPIVSADSRQIYRDLPIGTAAPSLEEQQRVKHYFIGIKDLHEDYNAGQYARDCNALLQELFTQHEHVIMVGGSMMYIDAVCKGLDDIPEVPEQIRTQVRESYKLNGLEWLQQEVQRLDPEYWEQVDQQNPQRLMHCVEVTLASEKPYSQFRLGGHKTNKNNHFDIKYIMIERPREELYERINLRVHKMIEAGLIQEARKAFEKLGIINSEGIVQQDENIPNSVNTVGYKELLKYFAGEWTLERAIEMIQQNSRHYAKRQITWWRRTAEDMSPSIIKA